MSPTYRSTMASLSAAVAIAVPVAFAIGLVTSRPAAAKERYEVGESVPSFTLKVLNHDDFGDGYVRSDAFMTDGKTPKKAVLLSFFATYCKPCKAEIPFMAALYDAYRDTGLQVVMVSIDSEAAKIEEARTLVKNAGGKFPVASDRFNILARRYFVEKLPNVYLVDGAGKVVFTNIGYTEEDSRILFEKVRKQLGNEGDPVPTVLTKWLPAAGAEPQKPVADAH